MSHHQHLSKLTRCPVTMWLTLGFAVGSLTVAGAPARADDVYVDAGRGPVLVNVPPSYDPNTPTPLILGLHGYSGWGAQFENYVGFTPLSDDIGFLYAYPSGTPDLGNFRFWNATNACCDVFESGVDDSTYLYDLIEVIKDTLNVDGRRVHLVGSSNGAFMSYRMACDHAETIASIATMVGATFRDPDDCRPAEPVHVLHIHGSADEVILYEGGCLGSDCYPGAVETVERWAAYNGCSLVGEPGDPIDFDAGIPGAETEVMKYTSECDRGGSGELWTVVGGAHIFEFSDDARQLMIDWLYAHPKPCAGDLDGDDDIDLTDLAQLLANYGMTSGAEYEDGDLDRDGDVDLSDLAALLAVYGTTCE